MVPLQRASFAGERVQAMCLWLGRMVGSFVVGTFPCQFWENGKSYNPFEVSMRISKSLALCSIMNVQLATVLQDLPDLPQIEVPSPGSPATAGPQVLAKMRYRWGATEFCLEGVP